MTTEEGSELSLEFDPKTAVAAAEAAKARRAQEAAEAEARRAQEAAEAEAERAKALREKLKNAISTLNEHNGEYLLLMSRLYQDLKAANDGQPVHVQLANTLKAGALAEDMFKAAQAALSATSSKPTPKPGPPKAAPEPPKAEPAPEPESNPEPVSVPDPTPASDPTSTVASHPEDASDPKTEEVSWRGDRPVPAPAPVVEPEGLKPEPLSTHPVYLAPAPDPATSSSPSGSSTDLADDERPGTAPEPEPGVDPQIWRNDSGSQSDSNGANSDADKETVTEKKPGRLRQAWNKAVNALEKI